MSSASFFQLTANGYDPSTNADTEAYADGPTRTRNLISARMLPGTGNDQVARLYAEDSADSGTSSIGTSATINLDLQTLTDARGTALSLSDVAMLYIEHKAASAASSISVQANASNGFTNLLGTAANLTLPAGAVIVLYVPTAAALAVSGTNKVLDIINDDGAQVADYRFEVWGR